MSAPTKKLTPGQLLSMRKLAETDPSAAGPGWRALSESYTAVAASRTDTPQTVIVSPGAGMGHPGFWAAAAAKISIEGNLLPCDPRELKPATDREHFAAMAVAHGVLIHEAGHAAHSPNEMIDTGDAKVDQALTLLEEIRMEAQVVRNRPSDARWLRASAKELILDELEAKGGVKSAAGAFNAAVLLEGRVNAGSLKSSDLSKLLPQIDAELGSSTHQQLQKLLASAVNIADDDAEGQIAMAKQLAALMPDEGQQPDSGGPGGGSDLAKAIAEALGDASDEAADEARKGDGVEELDEVANQTGARVAINEAQQEAARNTMGGSGGVSPDRHEREPTMEERSARAALSREFKKVIWRDRQMIARHAQLPPGRLRSREALRRSAEIAQGRLVTAKPWKQRKRRSVDFPKLTCGVLIDTSGSMSYACDEISSSLWVIANAVHDNGGKVTGVLFGDTAEVVLPPEKAPRFVIQIQPSGGTEHVPEGIEMLGKLLQWEREEGPRLLVIVSDGYWYDAGDSQAAIEQAQRNGITVIHAGVGHIPEEHGADETVVIGQGKPMDLANVIGRVAVQELRAW